MMSLFVEFRLSVPAAVTSFVNDMPVAPVRLTLVPFNVSTVVSVLPLLSVRFAVPVLMAVAGKVNAPVDTKVMALSVGTVSAVTVMSTALRTSVALPVTLRSANSLAAVASVTPNPAAEITVAPVTLMSPAPCVTAPPAVTFSPVTVVAFNAMAFLSTSVVAPPEVTPTLRKSLLALSSVTLPVPAATVVAPAVAVITPAV